MKTYNEMAVSALQKINEYQKVQKHRRKTIAQITVSALSCCLVIWFIINAWQFRIPQATTTPQQTLQNDIKSTNNINITSEKTKNIIIINSIENISTNKMNIALFEEDFIKMSASQLNEYYGINVFPTVPSDLTNLDKAKDFGGYGIYRRNNGTGEVYYEQNILNYSNNDFTRSINIEITKDSLPTMDFGIDQENLNKSIISDTCVYLGCNASGMYQAKFIYKNTGFVLTTDGLSQEEMIAVIQSILE